MCVCVCHGVLHSFLCFLKRDCIKRKSWLELSTETGLRVKTGSEILHTHQCTVHPTVFLETEGGGSERVGGGGGWNVLHWVGVEEWVGRYAPCRTSNSLQGQRSSEEACCNRIIQHRLGIQQLSMQERVSRWKTARTTQSPAKLFGTGSSFLFFWLLFRGRLSVRLFKYWATLEQQLDEQKPAVYIVLLWLHEILL